MAALDSEAEDAEALPSGILIPLIMGGLEPSYRGPELCRMGCSRPACHIDSCDGTPECTKTKLRHSAEIELADIRPLMMAL